MADPKPKMTDLFYYFDALEKTVKDLQGARLPMIRNLEQKMLGLPDKEFLMTFNAMNRLLQKSTANDVNKKGTHSNE